MPEQDVVVVPETMRWSSKLDFAQRIGATVVCTAVAWVGVGSEIITGDPFSLVKYGLNELIFHETIPKVSAAELEKVRKIMERPETPRSAELTGNALYKFYHDAAASYGLHLPDSNLYFNEVINATSKKQAMGAINQFTNLYGINFDVPDSAGLSEVGLGIDTWSKKDFKLVDVKDVGWHLIQTMSLIPTELGKHMHIKNIYLVKGIHPWDGRKKMETDGLADGNTENLYILYPDVLDHEIGHFLDFFMASSLDGNYGQQHDPQFTDLNPPGFHYGGPTQEKFLDGPEQAVNDPYSFTDPAEDKADDYELILQRWAPIMYGHTPLDRKMQLLIARLDREVSGFAGYMDKIAIKHPPYLLQPSVKNPKQLGPSFLQPSITGK